MILQKPPEIERFLRQPSAGVRAVVLHGRDRGLVRERGQLLAAAVSGDPDDPFNVAVLSESDIVADDSRLEGELMAFSMIGGRRLVRLRLSGEKGPGERLAIEALAGHLAGKFNPDAFFLLETGALAKDSAIRKTGEPVKDCMVIACYDDEPAELARLVREALTSDRLGLTADALEIFVQRLPRERGVARREIERLILFLGPGSNVVGSLDDLSGFFGVEAEASLNQAALDAFGGRLAAAQSGLRRAAQEGESGVVAIRALGLHLGRLRRIGALQLAGSPPHAAVKAAGVFWKNEREMLRQARVWTLTALSGAQFDVLAADRACKQTGGPDQLLVERLAMSIAGRARRLGL